MNHKITEEEKQIRKDRVLYIYFNLREKNPKISIERFIKKKGITSESTARRIISDAAHWKQGEIDLFLAIYNPIKSDIEAIKEVLGTDAGKVSNEVAEEPKNYYKLKDGEIINHDGKNYKFVYTGICDSEQCNKCALNCGSENCICDNKIPINDVNGYFEEIGAVEVDKCTECGTEAAYTIYELAAKNQELQKELQKYKNDLNAVLDDRRKLECLLSDNANAIELNPKNDSLYKVLLAAYNQASNGKGKERHQLNDDEPFENQKICEISRRLGSNDYNLGQAVKKIYESKRLPKERAIAELLGAINYIAAGIIILEDTV